MQMYTNSMNIVCIFAASPLQAAPTTGNHRNKIPTDTVNKQINRLLLTPKEMKQINIVIAENQFLVREGLVSLIGRSPDLEAAGVAETAEELVNLLELNSGAVVLLDCSSFEFEPPYSLQHVVQSYPTAGFLALVNGIAHAELLNLQNMGLKNFLTKCCTEEEALYAIEMTALGKKYYSESVLDLLISKTARKQASPETADLTSSEKEIVRLIAEGLTTKQIASRRHLSFHTVMTHRKNIFRKLGVTNVSELMLHSIKSGWIDNIEYYI